MLRRISLDSARAICAIPAAPAPRLTHEDNDTTSSLLDLQTDAAVDKWLGNLVSVLSFSALTVLYCAVTFILKEQLPSARTVMEATKDTVFGEHVQQIEYTVGVAFASSFITYCLKFVIEIDGDKRNVCATAAFISIVSALHSIFAAGDIGIAVQGPNRPVSLARYMMWLWTTPAILWMSYLSSDRPIKEFYWASLADVVMVGTGLVWEVTSSKALGAVMFLTSCMCFSYVMRKLDHFSLHLALCDGMNDPLKLTQFRNIAKWTSLVLWGCLPFAACVIDCFPELKYTGSLEVVLTLFHWCSKAWYVAILSHYIGVAYDEKSANKAHLAGRESMAKRASKVYQSMINKSKRQNYRHSSGTPVALRLGSLPDMDLTR